LLTLRDDLRGFMEIRCHHWTNASLADAASMVCYGVLKALLKSAYPGAGESAIHNNLLQGLGGVVSVQPTIRLWELSRKILKRPELADWFKETGSSEILTAINVQPELEWLRKDVQDYLDQWGFRFSGELMLTIPSFQEDPVPLLDLLKTYLKAEGAGPAESIRRLESEQVSAASLQTPLVRIALRCTRSAIRLRERARSKQALLYNRCRRIALAIGSELVRRGTFEETADIFFLTYSEIDELLSGHAMFPGEVAATAANRKRAHDEASAYSAPDTFILPEGEYLTANGLVFSVADAVGEQMSGTGACGGQATAPAAVLASVADAHMLQAGDILVTRQTDPGWAPVFSLIRGLVIERGGMLSHGAIIAREFGLPCIVGVKDATSRISQRSLLFIDGDRGHVRILD
jgi:pyruvate,water dikinase